MAFTYDLSTTGDSLTISRVRLMIGDTVEDGGPRPEAGHVASTGQMHTESGNFDDAEILAALDFEGGSRGRAAAFLLETLAAEWSAYAGRLKTGPHDETQKQADAYAARAGTLRARFGWNVASAAAADAAGFSVGAKIRI